jgi:Fe-S cluster assembly ATP-binding protein
VEHVLTENILEMQDVAIEVSGKKILEDVNLEIPEGEVHVLLGPNGSGKSSLLMAVLGIPSYRVSSGCILFKGKDVTHMPVNERVKLGISVAFQNPPAIRGVKLGGILDHLMPNEQEVRTLLDKVKFPPEFLIRDVNLGFSGGEVKKSEVLQVLAQGGDFVMLDEPDSGVDVENLQVVGNLINDMLTRKSALLITHQGHILRYVNADKAHVLINGRIACSGEPVNILTQILNEGYSWCMKCPKITRSHQKQRISPLH